jgi:hypothetical protein
MIELSPKQISFNVTIQCMNTNEQHHDIASWSIAFINIMKDTFIIVLLRQMKILQWFCMKYMYKIEIQHSLSIQIIPWYTAYIVFPSLYKMLKHDLNINFLNFLKAWTFQIIVAYNNFIFTMYHYGNIYIQLK